MLTLILITIFNFNSVTIQGDKVITTSSNTTYSACEFTYNDENLDIINDIAETEGECFNNSIVSLY